MKALKRGDDVITEKDGIESIDWRTGAPLINPDWYGGPYTLIEDYVPPIYDENDEIVTDTTKSAEIAELKARLAALESDL